MRQQLSFQLITVVMHRELRVALREQAEKAPVQRTYRADVQEEDQAVPVTAAVAVAEVPVGQAVQVAPQAEAAQMEAVADLAVITEPMEVLRLQQLEVPVETVLVEAGVEVVELPLLLPLRGQRAQALAAAADSLELE